MLLGESLHRDPQAAVRGRRPARARRPAPGPARSPWRARPAAAGRSAAVGAGVGSAAAPAPGRLRTAATRATVIAVRRRTRTTPHRPIRKFLDQREYRSRVGYSRYPRLPIGSAGLDPLASPDAYRCADRWRRLPGAERGHPGRGAQGRRGLRARVRRLPGRLEGPARGRHDGARRAAGPRHPAPRRHDPRAAAAPTRSRSRAASSGSARTSRPPASTRSSRSAVRTPSAWRPSSRPPA